ncbi:MAG: hypothetical protein ACYDEJ_14730 [Desulfitobacteriaceae bacterium]
MVVSYIKIPLIALLLQGIPETVAVVTLAFVIAGIPLMWNKIIVTGIVLAFCAYLVRLFPIPFGLHTILVSILLFIVITRLGKGDVGLAFFASVMSYLSLIIFEFINFSLFMLVFGLKPETIFNDLVIRILAGEAHVFLLFISAFLINILRIKRGRLKF